MGFTQQEMADEDYSVEAAGDAGAAHVKPMEAGQVRKGGFIMIKGKPCKVLDVSTSKTGKHGHAKCHFVASNIFTGKKQEELCPATHNIDVPFVFREDYQIMDIGEEDDGGYLSLMAPAVRTSSCPTCRRVAALSTTIKTLPTLSSTSRRATAMCSWLSLRPAVLRKS